MKTWMILENFPEDLLQELKDIWQEGQEARSERDGGAGGAIVCRT